ncbi:P2R1A-PPP2R2A-interacting phosphatase regulator 1-like isoform X2 [Gigantopelta aegis]|uniref:P2R1A-PPP2R2A-interacting phosphatase regulator 1-like isoform X2 n=1 Tax=Gigantopelta aegis TaxID=1735272 RepID=UPI001B888FFC|nr:P2R1A-PPP2R2A-interacting phosphatase regulator 1-like isoform X2 [Gigantopelta aegis]
MSGNRMEVDHDHEQPSSSGIPPPGTLKRSNSAPMINALVATTHNEASTSTFRPAEANRLRRFSSSNMALHTASPTIRVPGRVSQIKNEESHIPDREAAHEREVRTTMQISSSWDGFHLDQEQMVSDHTHRRPRSFSETLHVITGPNFLSGLPSPTRVGKQCFSPSMQVPVKNNSFTPSPSPSPTRKSFLRSLSPIAVRPSPLGKRKLDTDSSDRFEYLSPPKKLSTGPSTPDRVIAHPLAHSVSSSSLDDHSPEQTVPQGQGSVPDLAHRSKSNIFGFMPLRHSHDIHMTDSESSDLVDSTDMSESPEQSCHHGNADSSGFTPIKPPHL